MEKTVFIVRQDYGYYDERGWEIIGIFQTIEDAELCAVERDKNTVIERSNLSTTCTKKSEDLLHEHYRPCTIIEYEIK